MHDRGGSAGRFAHWLLHTPGDWLFERSCAPAVLVYGAVLALGHVAGVPHTNALLLGNFFGPAAIQAGRALWHRDRAYFTRPQAFQHRHYRVPATEGVPLEMSETSKGVPRWLRALVRSADRGHRPAAVVDDWLAERSRVVSFVENVAVIAAAPLLGLPWAAVMGANLLFQNVPDALGLYLGARNRDIHRATRSGARQRPSTVRELQARGLDVPTPAAPEPPAAPQAGSRGVPATPPPRWPARDLDL